MDISNGAWGAIGVIGAGVLSLIPKAINSLTGRGTTSKETEDELTVCISSLRDRDNDIKTINIAFNIVHKQYSRKYNGSLEDMEMLNALKKIIEDSSK